MPVTSDSGRTVTLTDGDDRYVVPSDNALVTTIYGLSGNDIIVGGSAGGTIYGGDGDDILSGNANTVLVGGLGANLYVGGAAAVLNGNARDFTLYDGGSGGLFLMARNGSGDQRIVGTPSIMFVDGTTASYGTLSRFVQSVGAAGRSTQIADATGDHGYSGGVGTDTLVLNGNVSDYTLGRENGRYGTIVNPLAQGEFVLTANNGSGHFTIAPSIEIVRFQNGQYLSLKDVPAYVSGSAALALGGAGDDPIFQTRSTGYQFFFGGGGADTLYLNGNIADYRIRPMDAVSPTLTDAHGISYGGDHYSGVALTGTNGSGELLIDASVDTIQFRNGTQVAYADLFSALIPDASGNIDILHFLPEGQPNGSGPQHIDGSDVPDRLLLNGNTGDYRLGLDRDGSFVLDPRGNASLGGAAISIGDGIDTIQFASGQYLALRDLPAYVPGALSGGIGTAGNDLLVLPDGGDRYVVGGEGLDKVFLHGDTGDYRVQAVAVAATAGHPAVTGYELVANNGTGNLYIDQSTEFVQFQNGQTVLTAVLPDHVAAYLV